MSAVATGEPTPDATERLESDLTVIPESARTTDVRGQFWIWAGANIAPINWVLGALGVTMGLGLFETIAVLAVGNAIGMSLFGIFVIIGQRTGVTGMVLSRAVFGRRGAYVPAAVQAIVCMGWCAVNTWIVLDLVMALLGRIGVADPDSAAHGPRIVVAAIIMVIQVVIAWFGYRVIAAFERWTVPPTIAVLIAMTAVAWFGLDVEWGYAGDATLTTGQHIAALSAVMTAIGIGWGITWFGYAADYSRFVSTSVPARKLFLASALGQFIPVVWLGALGATLATLSSSSDPGEIIVDAYGVLAIPVLLLVVHGPLATNILNIYTCTVSTQALDIHINRRVLNLVIGAVAMAVVVLFVFNGDFAMTIDSWLIGIVGWLAPWAAVVLVHWFVVARRQIDAEALVAPPAAGLLPSVRPTALVALGVGIVFTWMFMYGMTPLLQGPIANALGGVDLSWLAGGIVAATTYLALEALRGRQTG
ncbi:cytosine permease [Mycolicibacterium litorale]|uniref:Cytosine permease n=1 Tax=Mycolicibacterium litorale TaxID=758802 RepID=A0AAD1MPY4_9MYCO|nr:cytosine permease [Mycolicibacterium litorale]MCV7418627.1 cytosine permease [Mycolicibacterium litorale]TDY05975.1 NCS1 nucleoside transporter family [Mycolicibacterium litorale]BBY14519.1 cytosine permease [Mycolicibacterium litorale]